MSLRFLCSDCGCEFIIPERFAKGTMERNGGKMPCEWCDGLNTEIIRNRAREPNASALGEIAQEIH